MNMNTLLTATLFVACGQTSLAGSESGGGWLDLFESGTFAAWTQVGGAEVGPEWVLEDRVVHRAATGGGDIITRGQYEDFELEFEWKISEGGNSGVKYRAHGSLGLEYQVLDDTRHPDRAYATHRAASIYDLVAAPDDKRLHPPGEWNHAKVVARGTVLEHWLNRRRVARIDLATPDGQNRFTNSKYRKHEGFGRGPGHILLQDHGDEVWYRNLRIRELTR